MRGFFLIFISGVFICSLSSISFGDYTGFSAWKNLSTDQKAKYAAGVLDSYLTFSMITPKAAYHFSSCLYQNKISDAQLAKGTEDYAVAHPEVQSYPVAAIVLSYLVQVCGSPPMDR